MRTITQANSRHGVWLAFLLIPLSGLATDIYLPSLPSIALAMGGSPSAVQLSLTIFLVGYGVGQLFIGNFMDSFGRYRIAVIALFLFGLSSLLIAFTHSIVVLNLLRFAQGLLAAVVVVAKRTFFVDVFTGATLRRYLSSFTIAWSMGPIVAPFIGGYLQTGFGWQANFLFLAAFAWIALIFEVLHGGETLRAPVPFRARDILSRYRTMLTHAAFLRGLLNVGIPYSSVMAFSMVSPFLIEHVYGLSPQVTGYAALVMGLAWMTGGFVARSQLQRGLLDKHVRAVFFMGIVAGTMALVSWQWSNIYTLVLFAYLVHAACGMVFNIYFSECLGMFPQFAGLSGGLTGGVAFMLTSALSYAAVTMLDVHSQQGMAEVYLLFAAALVLTGAWAWLAGHHAPGKAS